jgi:nucleoside-diphosphate-sugar epimerase
MEKILVTGANGFIGQHLVKRLLSEGYAVRGTRFVERPLYFFKSEEIEWRNLDLRKNETLKGVPEGISCVYHLAAIPNNDHSKTQEDFQSVNVLGTRALLEEAKKAGIKRFVYISTVEAAGYGDGVNPRKESDLPHPDNNYGKSKLMAEEIVLNGPWPFERVVVRLPTIYGPGTFLIVPKLFGMVKRGFYPLIGSGEALLEFCYVENAVQAIILAGTRPEATGELFYVADERSYSIREVISAIAAVMNKRVLMLHIPRWAAYAAALLWELCAKIFPFPPLVSAASKKPFLTRETVWWTTRNVNIVSTEKIAKVLGYAPTVSLNRGCDETWQWLKTRLE